MTYNPNSAFPRQATYVSGYHHQITPQRALNAPNYMGNGRLNSGGARSLAGEYNAIAQMSAAHITGWGAAGQVSQVVNRPGLIAAAHGHQKQMGALKKANQERSEQRMQRRFDQHAPGDPEATAAIGEAADGILGNKPAGFETPISTPGFNEHQTAGAPKLGRKPKTNPDQGVLPLPDWA